MTDAKPHLVRTADVPQQDGTFAAGHVFSHPLNPNSQVHMRSLGDAVGLQRMGVHLLRVPPGKEAFVFHAHYSEEEFLYILSGRGVAEIGDETFEVGPGDFMGFPTPSVGHNLRNTGEEDLVYLAAGERNQIEIADYPRLGKRVVRSGMEMSIHPIADAEGFPTFPRLGVIPRRG